MPIFTTRTIRAQNPKETLSSRAHNFWVTACGYGGSPALSNFCTDHSRTFRALQAALEPCRVAAHGGHLRAALVLSASSFTGLGGLIATALRYFDVRVSRCGNPRD